MIDAIHGRFDMADVSLSPLRSEDVNTPDATPTSPKLGSTSQEPQSPEKKMEDTHGDLEVTNVTLPAAMVTRSGVTRECRSFHFRSSLIHP
jgi:hypothetical protein